MKAKFTKGSWEYVPQDSTVYADNGNELVCETYSTGDDEYEANAHLIAAAPDMYKMIESLKCELFIMIDEVNDQRLSRVTIQTENQPDLVDMESIHLAEVLLAKARGVDNT